MQEQITLREFITKLRKIIWEDDFDIVEVIGIFNCLLWATWFFTHPTLFDKGQIYRTLGVLGNEYVWAAGYYFLATLKLYGIYIDRYRVRKWIAFMTTMVWLFVLATFVQENSTALLVAITAEIAVISAWEYLRHSRRQDNREIAKEIVKQDLMML